MRKVIAGVSSLVFLACLFGSSTLVDMNSVVSTVDGRPIKFAEVDSVYKIIERNTPDSSDMETLKTQALDSLIADRLIEIRIDSMTAELYKDRDFVRRKDRNIGETAKKILYQEKISAAVVLDSSEIIDHYNKNIDDFNVPEQVWAKHILIRRPQPDTANAKSEKQRKKMLDESDAFAKERAEGVLKKALDGEDWDSLAAIYSEDKQNSSKGGDLGFFMRGRMVPEFDSAAFSTPPGTITGPVSSKFGYHIIKVEELKPSSQKPLEGEVEDQIRSLLTREKEKEIATKFVDSLKEAGAYSFNEDVLRSDSTFSDGTWVMAVNESDTLFYDTYVDALPRFQRWKQVDSLDYDLKLEMLDYMKTSLLLSNAVRKLGYLENPEVVQAENEYVRREARQQVLNIMRDKEFDPTDDQVEAYFNEHIDEYKVERKLMVYHIIFEDSLFAETIRDSIITGADFVEMAKRYYPGEPEIREVAYNLDYIGPLDMGKTFYDAADKLDINEVSRPVKTEWGYHLIKLIQRKEDKQLSQVKPGIKHKLKTARDVEKSQDLVGQWRAVADIRIDDKSFEKYDPLANR